MGLKNKPLALVFHGFLGSSDDFKFLENKYQIIPLDLRPQCINESEKLYETWEQMEARVLLKIKKEIRFNDHNQVLNHITVFSYSMGSKVFFSICSRLLEILNNEISRSGFLSKKPVLDLVFISSHFGIYESQENLNEWQIEIKHRSSMNQKFLKILVDQSMDSFLEAWNALGLFNQDHKSQTDWSLGQVVTYFKSWNRNQENLPEEFFKSLDQIKSIFVFYGSEDLKYKIQALRFKTKTKEIFPSEQHALLNFYEIEQRSHRLLSEEDFKIMLEKVPDSKN